MRSKLIMVVFGALLAGLAVAHSGATPASAHSPHPGLNFWMAIAGVPSCSTQNGDATCDLAPDGTFVVDAHIDPLPSDLAAYSGFDVTINHDGVTVVEGSANTDAWPDCAFPAASYDDTPGVVVMGCAIGVPPAGPSTYIGIIGTISFTCEASGSLTLQHGSGYTDAYDDNVVAHGEDSATNEKLTINCVSGGQEPPVPTPISSGPRPTLPRDVTPLEPTAAAIATSTAQSQATATAKAAGTPATRRPGGTPTGTTAGKKDDGGLGNGAIIAIIVGGIAAAVTIGAGAWWYMQNRGATSGGPPPATGTGGAPPAT